MPRGARRSIRVPLAGLGDKFSEVKLIPESAVALLRFRLRASARPAYRPWDVWTGSLIFLFLIFPLSSQFWPEI